MTPEQRAKLPAYARAVLNDLERQISRLRDDVAMLVEATPVTTITSGYAHADRPHHYLPDDSPLMLHDGAGRHQMTVEWSPGTNSLEVRSINGPISVVPVVSNTIVVKGTAR